MRRLPGGARTPAHGCLSVPGRLLGRYGHGIRYRLLLLVLLPTMLLLPLLLLPTLAWGERFSQRQSLARVATDLSVAEDVFRRIQRDTLDALRRLADSYALRTALAGAASGASGASEALAALLRGGLADDGFGYVRLLGPDGGPHDGGPPPAPSPLLDAALAGRAASGIERLDAAALDAARDGLAARARIEAAGSQSVADERGLLVRAAVPVLDGSGAVLAVLDGGVLLNRNFRLVDEIRDLVYGPGTLLPGAIGTATLFLDDLRVSTNVPLHAGERALGTRVSPGVRAQVLEHGERWLGRAFVVNAWYVSGYAPVLDVHGVRVGMLYTGFLEAPFREAWDDTAGALIGACLLADALLGAFALWLARSIFRPLERLLAVARAVRGGALDARVQPGAGHDELVELAREFDAMLDRLVQHEQALEAVAQALEATVAERTDDLRRQNARLAETVAELAEARQRLLTSEQLAALGALAAGVAHEINNPLAVLLGNLDVMVAELGPAAGPVQVEIDLAVAQVERIRRIVRGLLDYARPHGSAHGGTVADLPALFEETLMLAGHSAQGAGVELVHDWQARQALQIPASELQQVLLNLIVNALQALAGRGRLRLASADDGARVCLVVADDGPGIAAADLPRVFDPFFTTRAGGTGLGLAVSFAIVRRHGGEIVIDAAPGEGCTVTVRLPALPGTGARAAGCGEGSDSSSCVQVSPSLPFASGSYP